LASDVIGHIDESRIGYKQSRGDPDVYLRKRTRPNDQDYYEILLVFVDDILCISHAPEDFMKQLAKVYDLRGPVKEPKIYLGSNISKRNLPDGTLAWAMSSDTYVKNMLNTVKALLLDKGRELRTTQRRGRTPLPANYKPELDVTRELDTTEISEYLQLIGMLRWALNLAGSILLLRLPSCHSILHLHVKDIWKHFIAYLHISHWFRQGK
jgi:hypothetical protein